jgi:hypothetical protein
MRFARPLMLACLALTALEALAQSVNLPPSLQADVRNVPTTLHGITVDDPYRWLEDTADPRARAWMLGQGEHTRGSAGPHRRPRSHRPSPERAQRGAG